MEGFLEVFIYLLITIVILVLSMRRKKVMQPPGKDEDRPGGNPFSELFKDPEKEYDIDHEPVTISRKKETVTEEPSPWMSESEARDMVINTDAIIKEAADNPIAQREGRVADDVYGVEAEEDKGIDFDLKKAVIHSVILERRTY